MGALLPKVCLAMCQTAAINGDTLTGGNMQSPGEMLDDAIESGDLQWAAQTFDDVKAALSNRERADYLRAIQDLKKSNVSRSAQLESSYW